MLHFAVKEAAPVGAGEEGPADFDFTFRFIESVEAGGADDAAGLVVDGDEGATRGESIAEENLEDFFFVAVGVGMLFPDEGVGGDREEGVEIGGSERPDVEELAGEGGLEVERHPSNLTSIGKNPHPCPLPAYRERG